MKMKRWIAVLGLLAAVCVLGELWFGLGLFSACPAADSTRGYTIQRVRSTGVKESTALDEITANTAAKTVSVIESDDLGNKDTDWWTDSEATLRAALYVNPEVCSSPKTQFIVVNLAPGGFFSALQGVRNAFVAAMITGRVLVGDFVRDYDYTKHNATCPSGGLFGEGCLFADRKEGKRLCTWEEVNASKGESAFKRDTCPWKMIQDNVRSFNECRVIFTPKCNMLDEYFRTPSEEGIGTFGAHQWIASRVAMDVISPAVRSAMKWIEQESGLSAVIKSGVYADTTPLICMHIRGGDKRADARHGVSEYLSKLSSALEIRHLGQYRSRLGDEKAAVGYLTSDILNVKNVLESEFPFVEWLELPQHYLGVNVIQNTSVAKFLRQNEVVDFGTPFSMGAVLWAQNVLLASRCRIYVGSLESNMDRWMERMMTRPRADVGLLGGREVETLDSHRFEDVGNALFPLCSLVHMRAKKHEEVPVEQIAKQQSQRDDGSASQEGTARQHSVTAPTSESLSSNHVPVEVILYVGVAYGSGGDHISESLHSLQMEHVSQCMKACKFVTIGSNYTFYSATSSTEEDTEFSRYETDFMAAMVEAATNAQITTSCTKSYVIVDLTAAMRFAAESDGALSWSHRAIAFPDVLRVMRISKRISQGNCRLVVMTRDSQSIYNAGRRAPWNVDGSESFSVVQATQAAVIFGLLQQAELKSLADYVHIVDVNHFGANPFSGKVDSAYQECNSSQSFWRDFTAFLLLGTKPEHPKEAQLAWSGQLTLEYAISRLRQLSEGKYELPASTRGFWTEKTWKLQPFANVNESSLRYVFVNGVEGSGHHLFHFQTNHTWPVKLGKCSGNSPVDFRSAIIRGMRHSMERQFDEAASKNRSSRSTLVDSGVRVWSMRSFPCGGGVSKVLKFPDVIDEVNAISERLKTKKSVPVSLRYLFLVRDSLSILRSVCIKRDYGSSCHFQSRSLSLNSAVLLLYAHFLRGVGIEMESFSLDDASEVESHAKAVSFMLAGVGDEETRPEIINRVTKQLYEKWATHSHKPSTVDPSRNGSAQAHSAKILNPDDNCVALLQSFSDTLRDYLK